MATTTANKNVKQYTKREVPDFPSVVDFLNRGIKEPGYISKSYSMFKHTLSISNSIIVAFQCAALNIPCGPSDTFKGWNAKNRRVMKGQKGLFVWHPRDNYIKKVDENTGEDTWVKTTGKHFILKPTRYVLAQTEGEDFVEPDFGDFNVGDAIVELEIEPVPFTMDDGNCMGYARGRTFAVNPLGDHQLATTLHEMAHIVLGHTEETMLVDGGDRTPRDIAELEAEGTAMIVLDIMGVDDVAQSRGYMQRWNIQNLDAIPDKSAHRIFSAANQIVRAGFK